jgi:hypothetical protein
MPKTETRLLLERERSRLENRAALDASTRKYNEFRVREKVNKWFGAIPDIRFAFRHLPVSQVTRLVSETLLTHMFDLFLEIVSAYGEKEGGYYILPGDLISTGKTMRRKRKGKTWRQIIPTMRRYQEVRPITPKDEQRVKLLRNMILELAYHLGENDIKELVETLIQYYDIE